MVLEDFERMREHPRAASGRAARDHREPDGEGWGPLVVRWLRVGLGGGQIGVRLRGECVRWDRGGGGGGSGHPVLRVCDFYLCIVVEGMEIEM